MRQKVGTIIFAVFIVIGLAFVVFSRPRCSRNEQLCHVDTSAVKMFEDSLLRLDSLYEVERAARWNRRDSFKRKTVLLPTINRHPFDPNTADSIELLEQGFKPWQVRIMQKYKAKGGKWRKADDLLKMYGIDTAFFDTIRPFIVIKDTLLYPKRDSSYLDSLKFTYQTKKDTVIELNSCDTSDLKLIRGIGSYIAKQIVRYRDELGGYCDIEQLKEIKAVNPETYDKISSNLTVDSLLIRHIDVNHASVAQLSRHPYIRAEQAKQVYDYRRTVIRVKRIEELKERGFFSEQQWQKIRPYLALE